MRVLINLRDFFEKPKLAKLVLAKISSSKLVCVTFSCVTSSSFTFQDKRMSAADTTLLTRQREMLLQKLDEFERTNKALRRLLREQQATEVHNTL